MTNTENDFNSLMIHTGDQLATLSNVTTSLVERKANGSADLLDAIGGIRLIELAADQARRALVAEARATGYTWQEIGDTLGVSRQAAQERFSR